MLENIYDWIAKLVILVLIGLLVYYICKVEAQMVILMSIVFLGLSIAIFCVIIDELTPRNS